MLLAGRIAGVSLVIALSAAMTQSDAMSRARAAYNAEQYDEAIRLATLARARPEALDAAATVLVRAHLERYRLRSDAADLQAARQLMTTISLARLSARERAEHVVGQGMLLFFDEDFGPASEIFAAALPQMTDAAERERVFDWWASALDRHAQFVPDEARVGVYARLLSRVEDEMARRPTSPAAAYWLAAAARGAEDIDRAWSAAVAAWVRAPGQSAARADLDRLMFDAIIPDRARRLTGRGDPKAAIANLRAEWEGIKSKYGG